MNVTSIEYRQILRDWVVLVLADTKPNTVMIM